MPIGRGHAHKRNQDIRRSVRAMVPKEEVVSIGGQAEGYIYVVACCIVSISMSLYPVLSPIEQRLIRWRKEFQSVRIAVCHTKE